MNRRFLGAALLCTVLLSVSGVAVTEPVSREKQQVQAVLDDSAAGWRGRDIARFIAIYERGADTVYVSHDTVTSGFDAIRAVYAERFHSTAGDMGTLSVRMLSFRVLDHDHASVLGQYRLVRSNSPDATGITSLLFHRGKSGWHIIADHTD